MASSSNDVTISDPMTALSQVIDALVDAMIPLLSSPNSQTVQTVVSTIRQLNAPQDAIATALAVFSKLIRPIPQHSNTFSNNLNANPTNNNHGHHTINPHQVVFRSFIRNLEVSGIVTRSHLYLSFDPEDRKLYVDHTVNHLNDRKRVRTRMWFTQTRFNLFCEQSEGYAKLFALFASIIDDVTIANNVSDVDSPNSLATNIISGITILIGEFSLDTNRVIEVVLSAASEVVGELISRSHDLPFDHRLPPVFAAILNHFPKDHVFNVVGAMFHVFFELRQLSTSSTEGNEESHPVSNSDSLPVSPSNPNTSVRTPTGSTANPENSDASGLPSRASFQSQSRLTEGKESQAFGSAHVPVELSPSTPSTSRTPPQHENEWVQNLLAMHVPSGDGKAIAKNSRILSNASAPRFDYNDPVSEKRAFKNFLGLVVVLLRESLFTIPDIWRHLYPYDIKQIFSNCEKFELELAELSKYICSSTREPPKHIAENPLKCPRKGATFSNRDIWSQYRFISQGPFSGLFYQKFELINMLISMCRWRDAKSAILHLNVGDENVDIAADPNIAKTITALVEILLTPALRRKWGSFYTENRTVNDAIEKLGGVQNGYVALIWSVDDLLSPDSESAGADVRDMLYILGPYARGSVRLLYSLCRLLKGRKEETALSIMREVVLPSACCIQSNAGLSEAIWEVLSKWTHAERWNAYGHLQSRVLRSCAVYQIYAKRASYEMRYVLKRLTSETRARHIPTVTKITHGQALAAFSASLDRIQGYPADTVTVTPIVEVCNRCGDLALDMLIFLAVDRMADSRRSRLKRDGINVAQWYATLSLFLGIALRKLPLLSLHIEGVTNFFCKKLAVEPEPLLITALSDIIKGVADVEVDINLTTKQEMSFRGGKVLQELVSGVWGRLQPDTNMIGQAFDPRAEREKRDAVFSFQSALARSGVHVDLAISIAQLTRTAMFDDDIRTMPLKLCANIVDRTRASLTQLMRFLETVPKNIPRADEVQKALWRPLNSIGLAKLLTEFNCPTSSAVVLMSPTLDYLNSSKEIEEGTCVRNTNVTPQGSSADHGISPSANREDNSAGKYIESAPVEKTQTSDAKTDANGSRTTSGQAAVAKPPSFSQIISNKTKGILSPTLIETFWALKLNDIDIPEKLYDEEKARMTSLKKVWEKEYERFRRHASGDSERARRCDVEYRIIRDLVEDLETEKKALLKRQKAVLDKLQRNREELSCDSGHEHDSQRQQVACLFLQECLIPRCRTSIPDALFCARFVMLMLELDIPIVSFTHFFETFLMMIPTLLRSCSENEALGVTRFTNEILASLEKWRSNKKIFEVEVLSSKRSGLQNISKDGKGQHFRHGDLCQWIFEMHDRLATGLSGVIVSKEYLFSRNCLSLLAGVGEFFPKVTEHAKRIEDAVGQLVKSEMEDIRLTANGVQARLRAGKVMRVPEHIFRLRPPTSHAPSPGGMSGSGNTSATGKKSLPKTNGDDSESPVSNSQPHRSGSTPEKLPASETLVKASNAGEGTLKNVKTSPATAKPTSKGGSDVKIDEDHAAIASGGPGNFSPGNGRNKRSNVSGTADRMGSGEGPLTKRARVDGTDVSHIPDRRPNPNRDSGPSIDGQDKTRRNDHVSPEERHRYPSNVDIDNTGPSRTGVRQGGVSSGNSSGINGRSPGTRQSPGVRPPSARGTPRLSPGPRRSPGTRNDGRDSPTGREKSGERGMKRVYPVSRDNAGRQDEDRTVYGHTSGTGSGGLSTSGPGSVVGRGENVGALRGRRVLDGNGGGLTDGAGAGPNGSGGRMTDDGPMSKRRREHVPHRNYDDGRSFSFEYNRQAEVRPGMMKRSPRGMWNDGANVRGGTRGGPVAGMASAGSGQDYNSSSAGVSIMASETRAGWSSGGPETVRRGRAGDDRRRNKESNWPERKYGVPHSTPTHRTAGPAGSMGPSQIISQSQGPVGAGLRTTTGIPPGGGVGGMRHEPMNAVPYSDRDGNHDRDRDHGHSWDKGQERYGTRPRRDERDGRDRERNRDRGGNNTRERDRDREQERDRDREWLERKQPPVNMKRKRGGNGGNGGGNSR